MSTNESEPHFEATSDDGVTEATIAPPVRKRWRKRSMALAGVVGALVIGSAATGIAATARVITIDSQSSSASSSSSSSTGNGTLVPNRTGGFGDRSGSGSTSRASDTTSATSATAAQSKGIVLIDTTLKYQQAEAAGTGIVLTSSVESLTNNHVVNGATSITVTIASTGKTYTADVVGTNPTSDIAVLQLEGATGLATAKLDTARTTVGDSVTAVGNAGGTGSLSAASGTVTALDQAITASGESGSDAENLTGLIETNADVVSGDSGGPLYDTKGEVVGIDTAASSGTSAVTGYAIPIASALTIARQIEAGTVSSTITLGYPAFLGIEVADSTTGSVTGATVAGVIDATPAASAGLAEGDTITAVDGTAVSSAAQLTQLLGSHTPGDSVSIGWTDAAGASTSATVVLIKGPAN